MNVSSLPQFAMYKFHDVAKKAMWELGIDGKIGYESNTPLIYIQFYGCHIKLKLTPDFNYDLLEYPAEHRDVCFALVVEIRKQSPIKAELEKAFIRYIPTTDDLYNWRLVNTHSSNLRFAGDLFMPDGTQQYRAELNITLHAIPYIQVKKVYIKVRKDERNSPDYWKYKFLKEIFNKRKLEYLRSRWNLIISRRDMGIKKTRWRKNNPEKISYFSSEIMDKYHEEDINVHE